MDGKRYRSVLHWVAQPQANHGNPLSWVNRDNDRTSDRGELVKHKTSFKEDCWSHSSHILKEKLVADITVGFFRLDQNKKFFGYTERSGTPVNLHAPAPVVNVNYQFRGETKALVMICMKPATAPKGKEHELIDNSDGMGFEHRLILPIIKQALFYSIDNGCCTCLRWHIKELVEAESGKD